MNIGDRQKGRIAAESVIHCGTSKNEIMIGLLQILSEEMRGKMKLQSNPYEKQGTTEAIVRIIKNVSIENLLQKSFYNL